MGTVTVGNILYSFLGWIHLMRGNTVVELRVLADFRFACESCDPSRTWEFPSLDKQL